MNWYTVIVSLVGQTRVPDHRGADLPEFRVLFDHRAPRICLAGGRAGLFRRSGGSRRRAGGARA